MKKILLVLVLLLFSSTSFAAAINKSGFEIDGIKCKIGSKSFKDQGWPNGHDIDQAECFQYYNPVIKEYIASRIK